MGLFSKILGENSDAEKVAKDLIGGIIKTAQQQASSAGSGKAESGASYGAPAAAKPSPSGFSWGEEMPNEENQFNFNGTYTQYFESIFRAEFSNYRIEKTAPGGSNRTVYTFYSGDRKALVTEIMSQNCSAKKLRRDCEAAGIPYLRYYYDHHGWWNTRNYVVTRTRAALGEN